MSFYNHSDTPKMYNGVTSHPLITNSQENMGYKKYVSIHSEDRDITKFPNSNEFDIELPEDLLSIVSIRLSSWNFPDNLNTFSVLNCNIAMNFTITNPYNPGAHGIGDPLQSAVFACLFLTQAQAYTAVIEEGNYYPDQMATALTNAFNAAVTQRVVAYFTEKAITDPTYVGLLSQFIMGGGYGNFIMTYNSVAGKIWFGNTSDGFTLLQGSGDCLQCVNSARQPEYSKWGLPYNVGLPKNNVASINPPANSVSFNYLPSGSGPWLIATLPGALCYYVEPAYKLSLSGAQIFYMELHGQNCIDEMLPYNKNGFTMHTNETNGRVNAAFAKITTPTSFCIDRDSIPYKTYTPPAERMRKLRIKFRYHNGQPVDFGLAEYSVVLEFVLLQPQQTRGIKLGGVVANNYLQMN